MFFRRPSWPSKPLPQLYTSPISLRANEWYIPQATDTIFLLLSLLRGRGEGENTVPPSPSEPKLPFPYEKRVPCSVSMILCYFPLLI